jgi:hypothetical protein
MYRQILVPPDGSERAVVKMKKNKSKPASFEKLRRQAEKRLSERDVDLNAKRGVATSPAGPGSSKG